MVSYLYGRIQSSMWFDGGRRSSAVYSPIATPHLPFSIDQHFCTQGVLLRQSRGTYVTQPTVLSPALLGAVQKLNVEVAFTMSTEITNLIFSILSPDQTELILQDGSSQYQVLDSLEEIANSTSSKVKRFQYTAFVRKEKVLLLWHDDVERILTHAADVERKLLTVVGISSVGKCFIAHLNLDMGSENTQPAFSYFFDIHAD